MTGYHGNFFLRSMDLLALPSVSPDNAFAYQLGLDEPVTGNLVCFQAGLLYTTSFGTPLLVYVHMQAG
jgi:protein transport protein SEC24